MNDDIKAAFTVANPFQVGSFLLLWGVVQESVAALVRLSKGGGGQTRPTIAEMRHAPLLSPAQFRHISHLKSAAQFDDVGPCVVMATPSMLQVRPPAGACVGRDAPPPPAGRCALHHPPRSTLPPLPARRAACHASCLRRGARTPATASSLQTLQCRQVGASGWAGQAARGNRIWRAPHTAGTVKTSAAGHAGTRHPGQPVGGDDAQRRQGGAGTGVGGPHPAGTRMGESCMQSAGCYVHSGM